MRAARQRRAALLGERAAGAPTAAAARAASPQPSAALRTHWSSVSEGRAPRTHAVAEGLPLKAATARRRLRSSARRAAAAVAHAHQQVQAAAVQPRRRRRRGAVGARRRHVWQAREPHQRREQIQQLDVADAPRRDAGRADEQRDARVRREERVLPHDPACPSFQPWSPSSATIVASPAATAAARADPPPRRVRQHAERVEHAAHLRIDERDARGVAVAQLRRVLERGGTRRGPTPNASSPSPWRTCSAVGAARRRAPGARAAARAGARRQSSARARWTAGAAG